MHLKVVILIVAAVWLFRFINCTSYAEQKRADSAETNSTRVPTGSGDQHTGNQAITAVSHVARIIASDSLPFSYW